MLLVLALAIVAFLPLAVDQLVDAGETALRERAESTALVAGADVSPLDVVLAALYFRDPPVKTITRSDLASVETDELGIVVPIFAWFSCGRCTIGWDLD
jgi:putative ABC transport system permease protein